MSTTTTAAAQSVAETGTLEFTLNGERLRAEAVAATTTLLDWLRRSGRTGSKCGCAEGDCGACTVAILERDAAGQATYRAINSCIALMPMFAGREVVTVEGLARGGNLHPVQAAMVEHAGSQCGYCTPGFVMSMFEGYYRPGVQAPREINDQLCGNLCRCTGYRPIREAMVAALRARAGGSPPALVAGRAEQHQDIAGPATNGAGDGEPFAARLKLPVAALEALNFIGAGERFLRPTSLVQLLALRTQHPEAALVAGATEIGVDLNKKFKRFPLLLSTEAVPELTQITCTPEEWRIGAGATLTAIEETLAAEFPSLGKMLAVFASRQIRNRATLGGNLVTASPIGDSAPVLLTLEASVVLASVQGERSLPLHEFFTGYRKTQLRSDEVLRAIVLPRVTSAAGGNRRADFQKVSHRRELDISIVAGAFWVETDTAGVVRRARIAYGGVAIMPLRARQAEAALQGHTLAEAAEAVALILNHEFKPIDDVRGSAAYRRGVVVSLWRKFAGGETSLAMDAPPHFTPGRFCGRPEELESSGRTAHAAAAERAGPAADVGLAGPVAGELASGHAVASEHAPASGHAADSGHAFDPRLVPDSQPAPDSRQVPDPAHSLAAAHSADPAHPAHAAADGEKAREQSSGGAGHGSRELRHESAVGHVTGRAEYVDDTAQRRPMLEVWPVVAPHARARILRRDAAAAMAVPGVVAVLMAEDIPGHNNVGVSRPDETLFARDEVLFHGHIVALVVGETVAICRAAAALVRVEYEPLPAVLTVAAAVTKESFHNPLRVIQRGAPGEAIAAAPRRLTGEISIGGQEHFYLETQAAWAECGDDGDVFISSSTQHPAEIQTVVAEVLHLPRHRIVVQSPRMGGGFGGKETQGNTPAALVALAALKTGRPVRLQWDRDLDMVLTGKRHPFTAQFQAGFDREGRILGAEIDLISDGGWSLDLSQPVLERAMFHVDNAYYIPALRVTGRAAKTNVASNTAFRGFGGPQGMLVIEEIVDRIARTLGLAPEVVRERNFYHGEGETNRTHYGEDIGDHRLQTLWQAAREQARFSERRQEIDAWNRASGRVKRGLAITPVKFGISFTLTHYNQGGALVHIYQDGTAQVNHGGTEMGQGLHTKILGIAMRELGLPASCIRMMRTSTDKVPNTSATAASAGADLNGAAVRDACETLRERMRPVAAKMLEAAAQGELRSDTKVDIAGPERGSKPESLPAAAPPDVVFADGFVSTAARPDIRLPFAKVAVQCYVERVSLSSTGYYATPGIHWDWAKASGRPFAYYACGAAVSEVEVDGYSGMSRLVRVDIVHDVGESLNPGVDRGQIEGGFVQGAGWLTSEELKWDAAGRLLTHSASTYQIPAISDAPMEFNVTLLRAGANPHAIHGSKAVGEPPLMLALSVREAIRDAVASFGAPGGEVHVASPATGEAVFLAIEERLRARS